MQTSNLKITKNKIEKINFIPLEKFEIYTIEEIKKTYLQDNKELTDEEAIEIKKYLEQLLEIVFLNFQNQRTEKENKIKIENEKSNLIYTSEYRRAS